MDCKTCKHSNKSEWSSGLKCDILKVIECHFDGKIAEHWEWREREPKVNYCESCTNGIKGIELHGHGQRIKWDCDFPPEEETYCKNNDIRYYYPKLKQRSKEFISEKEMIL